MTVIDDFVVLVDGQGTPVGEQRKSLVHTAFTPLHLAFSVYLFDRTAGNVLVTRRALEKLTWPGSGPTAAAVTRGWVRNFRWRSVVGPSELGLQIDGLSCVLPDFAYQARDASGICENEICPVFVGTVVQQARAI